MLAINLVSDARRMDLAVIVSADKDFRPALIHLRDDHPHIGLEVAIWQAIPGGEALGRIELRHDRPDEPEVPCHFLNRHDFAKWEDQINYKARTDGDIRPRPGGQRFQGGRGYTSVFPRPGGSS